MGLDFSDPFWEWKMEMKISFSVDIHKLKSQQKNPIFLGN